MSINKELALLFTKLGFIAFGGPMAHIALMEKEVVEKRNWFSAEEYLEMISFTNFLPGPNSTEVAILIGYKKAKIKGMLISGACFILPAVVIVLGLTFTYISLNTIPNVNALFSGFRPVIAAIVTTAAYKLCLKFFRKINPLDLIIFLVLTLLLITGFIQEIQALLIGGVCYLLIHTLRSKSQSNAIEPFSLGLLFLTMFKIGAILYGSGYVLMSYLKTELVDSLQWLDLATLTDLLTLGEISPGPVFTTATAVGAYLGGMPGGLLATLGIFLPSFTLIGILYPLFNKMKKIEWFQILLKGINIVSLTLIVTTALNLSQPLLYSPVQVALYLFALLLMNKTKVSNMILLLSSGILGILFL